MLEMKTIGKPCAGKSHARFEEEVQNSQKGCSGFTLLDSPLITQIKINRKSCKFSLIMKLSIVIPVYNDLFSNVKCNS